MGVLVPSHYQGRGASEADSDGKMMSNTCGSILVNQAQSFKVNEYILQFKKKKKKAEGATHKVTRSITETQLPFLFFLTLL